MDESSSAPTAERAVYANEHRASLKHRYVLKLIASVAAVLTGFGVETIAPRALGPAAYGDYYFLQQFFTQVLTLLCGGMSLAFTTRLSRRPRVPRFVGFYFTWLLIVPLFVQAFIFAAKFCGFDGILWPDIHLIYIELSALAAYFVFLGREATALGDALGLTVPFERVRIVQRIISLLLLIGLFWAGLVDLRNLILYLSAVNAGLVVALLLRLWASATPAWPNRLPDWAEARAISHYFYRYSSPIVVYLLFAIMAGLFDRWLLEVIAGSVQQGYFSLGFQVSAMLSLFTSAMAPLLMREMSIAHGQNNSVGMARLYVSALDGLYFTAAFFSCFIACQVDRIAVLMGGASFAPSALAMGVLILAPLHQAYGQVSTTLYYATGQTKLFRNLAVILHVGGVFMTWILVGPKAWFAFDLGSTGLALKFTLFQVITSNVFVYFNCRYLNISYRQLVGRQIVSPALLLSFGLGARFVTSFLPIVGAGVPQDLVRIASAGLVYVALASIVVLALPGLAGLDRHQLYRFVASMRGYVSSRSKT